MDDEQEFAQLIKQRFDKLPKVVRDAIVSADVSSHMRLLAEQRKLHIDQWEALENEVQLTLLGVHPAENLAENLSEAVGIPQEEAASLAGDISTIIFEPIRQELERELEHPDAVAAEKTSVETMRDAVLANATPIPVPETALATEPVGETPVMAASAPSPLMNTAPVVAATPPNPAPQVTVERTPAPLDYTPSVPSHARKSIEGDPYRESVA